jgi:hypothetical protein
MVSHFLEISEIQKDIIYTWCNFPIRYEDLNKLKFIPKSPRPSPGCRPSNWKPFTMTLNLVQTPFTNYHDKQMLLSFSCSTVIPFCNPYRMEVWVHLVSFTKEKEIIQFTCNDHLCSIKTISLPLLLWQLAFPGDHTAAACPKNPRPEILLQILMCVLSNNSKCALVKPWKKVGWTQLTSAVARCWLLDRMKADHGLRLCLAL